jgi:hypothetical protein
MISGLHTRSSQEQSEPDSGGPETSLFSVESGLPVPRLPQRHRGDSVHYTVTTVGHNGRLGDRSLVKKLDWAPGQRLMLDASSDAITAYTAPAGDRAITRDGFLMLPAALRHRCDIRYRDQVFVAAYPHAERLVIWTLSALDDMVATRLTDQRPRSTDGQLG